MGGARLFDLTVLLFASSRGGLDLFLHETLKHVAIGEVSIQDSNQVVGGDIDVDKLAECITSRGLQPKRSQAILEQQMHSWFRHMIKVQGFDTLSQI